jgi:hypothetical protein
MSDEPATCACLSVADAMRHHLAEEEIPECPIHDVSADQGSAIALNDDNSLKAIIGAALGAPISSSTYHQENQ